VRYGAVTTSSVFESPWHEKTAAGSVCHKGNAVGLPLVICLDEAA